MILKELRKVRRLGGDTYSSAEVLGLIGRAADEIERLQAALTACGDSFISAPCSVAQGHSLLAAEFRRRMDIANAALSPTESHK